MQIYSHWARTTLDCQNQDGSPYHLIAYTGSDESVAAAQAAGQALVQSRHARLLMGELQEYPIGTAPLREELVQRLHDSHGTLIGALTRNRYGSLVLNAPRLMILDIDDEDLYVRAYKQTAPFNLFAFLKNLFNPASARTPEPLHSLSTAHELLQLRIATWLQLHPDWSFRLYRTRLGFRLIVTHQLLEPTSPEAQEAFSAMRTDTIYVRLCRSQHCYRARLSPKPWRIGLKRPPTPFPYDTPEQVQRQQEWEQEYTARSKAFSVCEWVGEYGTGQVHPEAKLLIQLHDAACLGGRKLA